MKPLTKELVLTLLSLCFLVLLVLPVFANNNVSPISDIMTAYNPDGSILSQIIVTEADEMANGPGHLYKLPNVGPLAVDLGLPPIPVTWFYEPGGNAVNGPWSDMLGIAGTAGTEGSAIYNLAFFSDVNGVLLPYGPKLGETIVQEQPGVPYDITQYLAPDLRTAGYTATFVSDANAVPEPSTMLLLGSGLLGLLGFRRKLKR